MPDAEFQLLIDQTLSPDAQARIFADTAIEAAKEIQQADEQIVGHPIVVKKFVDGVLGASEYNARINSLITYDFGAGADDAVKFIALELQKHSPVGASGDRHPGLYLASHILLADGVQVAISDNIPDAAEYTFASTLPYSKRIEDGESSQAPSGVYELVANRAAQQFGSVRIQFVDYNGKYPAITVTVK